MAVTVLFVPSSLDSRKKKHRDKVIFIMFRLHLFTYRTGIFTGIMSMMTNLIIVIIIFFSETYHMSAMTPWTPMSLSRFSRRSILPIRSQFKNNYFAEM